MNSFLVRSFYCFHPLTQAQAEELASLLRSRGKELGICGLVLIAGEGCNVGVSGIREAVESFSNIVRGFLSVTDLDHKDTATEGHPFPRLKVVVKEEIVTSGAPRVFLPQGSDYLSPAEWEAKLHEPGVIVLDTRNVYETKLGMFQGAVDLKIDSFSEFPAFVESSGIAKDATVLMYCTGGIRCEKASLQMRELGYHQVYQLQGGILRYLEQFPHRGFDGECFVFDERIAVTQDLTPSEKYRLCVHCGEPTEIRLSCCRCGAEGIVCDQCSAVPDRKSCSKDCAYHVRRLASASEVEQNSRNADCGLNRSSSNSPV